MKDIKQIEGWEWNESLSQYERGDFRVVRYESEFGAEYYRLQIRCNGHPELDASSRIDIEHVDVVCRTLVESYRELRNVELKY